MDEAGKTHLARYERDVRHACLSCDLVVYLARQQPQGEANNAAFVTKHALDGEVRLAGIRGAEHGGDAAAAMVTLWGVEITHWPELNAPAKRWKLPKTLGNQALKLTNGTILEQTPSESLTRGYSIFVHYDMLCCARFWAARHALPGRQ